jgi:hypothetical protein
MGMSQTNTFLLAYIDITVRSFNPPAVKKRRASCSVWHVHIFWACPNSITTQESSLLGAAQNSRPIKEKNDVAKKRRNTELD